MLYHCKKIEKASEYFPCKDLYNFQKNYACGGGGGHMLISRKHFFSVMRSLATLSIRTRASFSQYPVHL